MTESNQAETRAARPGPAAEMARFDPKMVERPDPSLLTYYACISALTLIGFPFVMLAYYLRFRTLKYRFDEKGVSMSVGVLFRKEVYLTYRRIQDIHVTRNLFHRWLGLSEVAIQTASGSAGAEMTIEGLRDPEGLRDYLYSRMRGVEEDASGAGGEAPPGGEAATPGASVGDDEALALLREIRDELRAWRTRRTGGAEGGSS